jgi:arsenate reductase-like glutaredoxin family protein
MMQVYGSKDCVHCRSVINLIAMRGISFEFIELKEETDVVRLVDAGMTYTGLDEITSHLRGI